MFQRMFLDVDGPLAHSLVHELAGLTADAPKELFEPASLLCHRLRGDAATVGFARLGELLSEIEACLRSAHKGTSPEPAELDRVRHLAAEVVRRIDLGADACDRPLSS
jgi:HPt (histidine-containing phosphotransfer) domain-containing protein